MKMMGSVQRGMVAGRLLHTPKRAKSVEPVGFAT